MPSPKRPIRVCVLACSYEGSDSTLKEYEQDVVQTPQNFFGPDDAGRYTFHLEFIKKATSYRRIRQLVMSGNYDVFFNQCDGAKDEDRPGVDVVRALEEFQVPFTGAMSDYYEMSKPDMKVVCHYYGIPTARFCVVEPGDVVEDCCAGLTFPVIVKHISGYSSVGMDRTCKVAAMGELVKRVAAFMDEFQFALVEEFISGDEATILACNDASQPDGVRVFHPVQVCFPAGEDFKHFQLKWESWEGMDWKRVPDNDPALAAMEEMARQSFKRMMGGVGYGRVDVRIDRADNNRVVFLEINPNCGIMYPYGQEGSADWILRLSPEMQQKEFAMLQMDEAMRRNDRIKPTYARKFDPVRGYHLRSVRDIPAGTVVFQDEGKAVRLCTKPYVYEHFSTADMEDFKHNAWPIGREGHFYALWNHDPAHWRNFNHSCSPNLAFAENRSLNVRALRAIAKGEELTMDYRQFMDNTMPTFKCTCNASNCEGFVTPGSLMNTPVCSSSSGSQPLLSPDFKMREIVLTD